MLGFFVRHEHFKPHADFGGAAVKDRESGLVNDRAIGVCRPPTGLIAPLSVSRRWCAEKTKASALRFPVLLVALFRWPGQPAKPSLWEQNYAFTF